MAEEARLAEEARIQAELEAGAAAKQAYWDAQGDISEDEAKIVPDLPSDATHPALDDGRGGGGMVKLLLGVIVLGAAAGAIITFL